MLTKISADSFCTNNLKKEYRSSGLSGLRADDNPPCANSKQAQKAEVRLVVVCSYGAAFCFGNLRYL